VFSVVSYYVMKVKLAKTAGFCMGVRRAMELVLRTAAESSDPIFTLGPLIHNPQTVEFLREQGVNVIENAGDVREGYTVVIRSHGVPPDVREMLLDARTALCDATCPKVARVQGLVKKYASRGKDVVIVGHADHAEVKALLGYAGERGCVVSSSDEVSGLPDSINPVVIGQTTLNRDWYMEIAEAVRLRFPETEILDTLCDSTSLRQQEVCELAKESDAVVVVGGYNSSNTKRLFDVAQSTGVPSFWVETAAELSPDDFRDMKVVAVTAGASTPHWIVSRVIERLKRFGEKHIPPWEWPWLKNFGYAVVQGNVLTGLAAAMLATTAIFLLGASLPITVLVASGLFIFSMHTIYNLLDWQGLALVDPSKIRFFWCNRMFLAVASVIGLFLSLPLTWVSGLWPFSLMVFAVVVSALFAFIRRLPGFMARRGFATWRAIPGAKDVLHTTGWFFAAGILPVIAIGRDLWTSILVLGWVLMLSVLRAALFSITDLETDRVLGRESIATIVGERGMWGIAIATAALSVVVIVTGVLVGLFEKVAFLELALAVYMLILILRIRRSGILRGTWTELAVDGGYLLGGAIAVVMVIS